MRAILVSFRLDMARITMSSASGFVPFLLPLLFAVIFGLAGRADGGADFATGGVVGSVFGVGTILSISRYLTLPVFAAIIVAETTLALAILHLTAHGNLNGLAQALTTSVLGSTWSFMVFCCSSAVAGIADYLDIEFIHITLLSLMLISASLIYCLPCSRLSGVRSFNTSNR